MCRRDSSRSRKSKYTSCSLDDSCCNYCQFNFNPNVLKLMIEVQDLRKSFDGVEVLKGITTKFETGKVNLVIGQSGSGKTVFLKCLLNVFEPSEGHILFDGRDIVGMGRTEKEALRSEIGTVFQGSALFDSMTVQDNIMFPLDMFTNLTFTEKKTVSYTHLDVYKRQLLSQVL